MGLPAAAPINLDDLATRLGLPVVPIKVFADVRPEHVTQLTKTDKGAFSASLLRLDNGSRIILLNNGHGIGRRNSDLAHEISHALLVHPSIQPFDHTGSRSFDFPGADHRDVPPIRFPRERRHSPRAGRHIERTPHCA